MKISPYITLALAGLVFLLLTGCASFERGVPQNVIILSFPTEASVYVNGDAVGITPIEMSLPRKVVLEPGTMKAKLKSELVPNSTGADPFERMAQQAIEADRRLEAGEITPLEHKYIIEQIIEFFESKS